MIINHLYLYIYKYICKYIYIYILYITYIHTYLHTYIPTYLHTYIPTYLHTYIPKYLPTYLHTYIYIYIHIFIFIFIYIYIYTYSFYISSSAQATLSNSRLNKAIQLSPETQQHLWRTLSQLVVWIPRKGCLESSLKSDRGQPNARNHPVLCVRTDIGKSLYMYLHSLSVETYTYNAYPKNRVFQINFHSQ